MMATPMDERTAPAMTMTAGSTTGSLGAGRPYLLIITDEHARHHVLEGDGQKVVVDEVSLPFLANAVIDFSEELIGARFIIDNPNATSSCGCGTSFSV